jgi:hypothetical protein
MDKRSKLVYENLMKKRSRNPKNRSKNLIGGPWSEDSPYAPFKFGMSIGEIGDWGEMMFEEVFGMKSATKGVDLPLLNADIKTFTRAFERTKFSGAASSHLNPDWYFVYLIFPNDYQFWCIPGSDRCIKLPPANERKGKIDITAEDIERFKDSGYFCGEKMIKNIIKELPNGQSEKIVEEMKDGYTNAKTNV